MEKFCPNCGAELPENAKFCSQCGWMVDAQTSVEADLPEESASPEMGSTEPEFAPAEPEKPKKRLKWWMIAIPVVVALAIVVACMWGQIMLWVSPGAVLARASVNTNADLKDRLQETPLAMMAGVINQEGKYTSNIQLGIQESQIGGMDLDMTIRTDRRQGQQNLTGKLTLMGESVDVSAYLDQDCFAMGTSILKDGQYYGITYDTLSGDLRASPLFSDMSEESLEMFEESIQRLQDQIRLASGENGKEIASKIQQVFLDFYSEIKWETSHRKLELNGVSRNCSVVSFRMTQEDLADLLEKSIAILEQDEMARSLFFPSASNLMLGITPYDADSVWEDVRDSYLEIAQTLRNDSLINAECCYYIYGNHLVAIGMEADCEVEGERYPGYWLLNFGENPGVDDITLTLESEKESTGERIHFVCTLNTRKSAVSCGETLTIRMEDGGSQEKTISASYLWDRATGDLALEFSMEGDLEETVSLSHTISLKEQPNGFRMDLGNIMEIASRFEDAEMLPYDSMNLAIGVTAGAEITKPEYVNLDQWSKDDLFELISGLYAG